jgi:hypothetical protein
MKTLLFFLREDPDTLIYIVSFTGRDPDTLDIYSEFHNGRSTRVSTMKTTLSILPLVCFYFNFSCFSFCLLLLAASTY